MLLHDKQTVASGTPTLYSPAGRMSGRTNLAWQNFWTGTLAGTMTLWCSDKDDPDKTDDDDWSQVTDVTLTSPAGSASKAAQTIGNANHLWYRFKLVVSAGAGDWETNVNHVTARG